MPLLGYLELFSRIYYNISIITELHTGIIQEESGLTSKWSVLWREEKGFIWEGERRSILGREKTESIWEGERQRSRSLFDTGHVWKFSCKLYVLRVYYSIFYKFVNILNVVLLKLSIWVWKKCVVENRRAIRSELKIQCHSF